MQDKFRAVARRCFLDMGIPRVGREVVGLYATRKEAEDACTEFVKSQGDSFRAAYDDCIIEAVPEADKGKLDGLPLTGDCHEKSETNRLPRSTEIRWEGMANSLGGAIGSL
jgi:hypothetical protein